MTMRNPVRSLPAQPRNVRGVAPRLRRGDCGDHDEGHVALARDNEPRLTTPDHALPSAPIYVRLACSHFLQIQKEGSVRSVFRQGWAGHAVPYEALSCLALTPAMPGPATAHASRPIRHHR